MFDFFKSCILVAYRRALNSLKDSNVSSGRIRSCGMLLGLQHFGGVEGRARAPGWD